MKRGEEHCYKCESVGVTMREGLGVKVVEGGLGHWADSGEVWGGIVMTMLGRLGVTSGG